MNRIGKNLKKIGFALLGLPYKRVYKSMYSGIHFGLKKKVFLLSFDVDYERDVKALKTVLRSLKKLSIDANFAVVGKHVEKFPKEHKAIVLEGHEIVNHTYAHPRNKELCPDKDYAYISESKKIQEITECHEAVEKILGIKMKGFRLPHFGNIQDIDYEWLFANLYALNYEYDSSVLFPIYKRRFKAFFNNKKIIEIPISTCFKHPFTALDSYHIYRSNRLIYKIMHINTDWYLLLEKALDSAYNVEMAANIYLDPYDYVANIDIFEKSLLLLKKNHNPIFLTYSKYITMTKGG